MDWDDQFVRYFGTSDTAFISPELFATGTERMRVDFGLEKDPGRPFTLWPVMHMLKVAPDFDIAFKDEADLNAARTFMDLLDRADEQTALGRSTA